MNFSDETRHVYHEFVETFGENILFPTATWIKFINDADNLLATRSVPVLSASHTMSNTYDNYFYVFHLSAWPMCDAQFCNI